MLVEPISRPESEVLHLSIRHPSKRAREARQPANHKGWRGFAHPRTLVQGGIADPDLQSLAVSAAQRNRTVNEHSLALAREWKKLGRAATAVALLTSPIVFAVFVVSFEWPAFWALLAAIAVIVVFRGAVDVLAHKLIPAPAIYGAENELRIDDITSRRRVWYWSKKFRRVWNLALFVAVAVGIAMLVLAIQGEPATMSDGFDAMLDVIGTYLPVLASYAPIMLLFFVMNFLILLGPMLLLGIQQIKGYEPGDADWGVKLDDIRGQQEAKAEITKVVSLWQSGEEFEKAGGKRERGVLFLGPPGTGKTMLSKGIATSFNCPFVTIPGSGFAQTFIGIDAIIVRFLARKAKKLAAKWGGQCIVFIDEIDAVGMRRRALSSGFAPYQDPMAIEDHLFFGPAGAITPDGDLVIESRRWRDRLFEQRAEPPGALYPQIFGRIKGVVDQFMIPGMGGGGSLALNQLLVTMDGINEPPFKKKFMTNRLNTFLDALYIVPRKAGPVSLRLRPPKPRKEEIYFIGACNVPLETLDPALTRPGRMGAGSIFFRTPTSEDRRASSTMLPYREGRARRELDHTESATSWRVATSGCSPAMSTRLLHGAHLRPRDNRPVFGWDDIVEAMTTVEAGVAIGHEYPPHEERATTIHEAGHAVCSHLYNENLQSTRLSIRERGASGGHHQAMEIEERFADSRSEMFGRLIHILGAIAAEVVFYGQNTTGVGGDVRSVTWLAGRHGGLLSPRCRRRSTSTSPTGSRLRNAATPRRTA